MIDPLREAVDLYRTGDDGRYHLVDEGDPPRRESKSLPGVWLDPGWLWQEPLPDVDWILEQWMQK